MDLFTLIRKRPSIRAHVERNVEEAKLTALLDSIRATPSAGNLQASGVIVVRDPESKRALARAAVERTFFAQAPVVPVFHLDPDRSARFHGRRGRSLYPLQDAAIACTHAHLAATAPGPGSCWAGALTEDAVRAILKPPEPMTPVAPARPCDVGSILKTPPQLSRRASRAARDAGVFRYP